MTMFSFTEKRNFIQFKIGFARVPKKLIEDLESTDINYELALKSFK